MKKGFVIGFLIVISIVAIFSLITFEEKIKLSPIESVSAMDCPEDVNYDGEVNEFDMIRVRNHLGERECKEENNWCDGFDVDESGVVSILDLGKIRVVLGKVCDLQYCERNKECLIYDDSYLCNYDKCNIGCGWTESCESCSEITDCSNFIDEINCLGQGCGLACSWQMGECKSCVETASCSSYNDEKSCSRDGCNLGCGWFNECLKCEETKCEQFLEGDCANSINIEKCGLTCTWNENSCIENNKPVLEQIQQQVIKENEKVEFELFASDSDGDSLSFSSLNLPARAILDNNGRFSWQTTSLDIGNYYITFEADDGKGGKDSKTIVISVVPEQVEQPEQVMIIVNEDYPDENNNGVKDSIEVGEYYREKRNIPQDNVCHINFGASSYGIANGDDVSMTVDKYLNDIKPKILECLEKEVDGVKLKNKILYVVMAYGAPLRIVFPKDYDSCLGGEERLIPVWGFLALDSEVSDIYTRLPFDSIDTIKCADGSYLPSYRIHPYNKNSNRKTNGEFFPGEIGKFDSRYLVYLVTRIDGPNVEYAKGLVDKAIYAEKYLNNKSGKAYFRSNTPAFENSVSGEYGLFHPYGDKLKFAKGYIENAGFEAVYSKVEWAEGAHKYFENLKDVLFFWSWYYPAYYDMTKDYFKIGGVGMDIDSYSLMENLGFKSSDSLDRWCEGLVKDGITATMCTVGEPSLGGLPLANDFYEHFMKGYNFAEAGYYSQPVPHWSVIFLGDPFFKIPKNPELDKEAPVISDVNKELIKGVGSYFASIKWNTDEAAKSRVLIGVESGNYDRIANDEWMTTEHKIYINNLEPEKTYYYKVLSEDPAGNSNISEEESFIVPSELPERNLLFYAKLDDAVDSSIVINEQDSNKNALLLNNVKTSEVSSDAGFSGSSFLLDTNQKTIKFPSGSFDKEAGEIEFYFKPFGKLENMAVFFQSNYLFRAYWLNYTCNDKTCISDNQNKGKVVLKVGGVRGVITENLDLTEDRFYHLRFVWRKNPVIREVYLDGILVGRNNIMPWYEPGVIGDKLYFNKGFYEKDFALGYYDEIKIYSDVEENDFADIVSDIGKKCIPSVSWEKNEIKEGENVKIIINGKDCEDTILTISIIEDANEIKRYENIRISDTIGWPAVFSLLGKKYYLKMVADDWTFKSEGLAVTRESSPSGGGGGGRINPSKNNSNQSIIIINNTNGYWNRMILVNLNGTGNRSHIQELLLKDNMKITLNETDYFVGIVSVSNDSVMIRISTEQEDVKFYLGEEKKFDLTKDEYYDLSVILKSINIDKIDIILKEIHEKIVKKEEIIKRLIILFGIILTIFVLFIIIFVKKEKIKDLMVSFYYNYISTSWKKNKKEQVV